MRIGICDDEAVIIQEVKEKCLQYFKENMSCGKNEIYTSLTGIELIGIANKLDIVILDIEMPARSGFDIANELSRKNQNILIIFLTSHEEFWKESFSCRPFGYLVKPLDSNELFQRLDEARTNIMGKKHILIQTKSVTYGISMKNILYIESLGDESCVHLVGGEYYQVRWTLKKWMKQLDEFMFKQCNRSCIVSLQHIKNISNKIVLSDNSVLRISERRKRDVKESYIDFVENRGWLL